MVKIYAEKYRNSDDTTTITEEISYPGFDQDIALYYQYREKIISGMFTN